MSEKCDRCDTRPAIYRFSSGGHSLNMCEECSKAINDVLDSTPTISECIAMFKRMGMVGWVAMEEDGEWGIHSTEPICVGGDFWSSNDIIYFTAQPVADWKKSKRRIE